MKVIIIKEWKTYKVNDVVEVANGFGTNFLIKNGYALPINKATSHNREKQLALQAAQTAAQTAEALELKAKIEELNLVFYLKTTGDVVHGSITAKKVHQALVEQEIKLVKHALPHILIQHLGFTTVSVKLANNISAQLKIEVRGEQ